MSNSMDDTIYNWNGMLRQNHDGAKLVAAQRAAELKHRGFSESEALDVMVADNLDIRIAEAMVSAVYNPETFQAKAVEVKPVREAKVVPTSYRDVMDFVEDQLLSLTPREFVNRLARTKNPIMPVNEKAYASYVRLAERALEDEHARNLLHSDLQKYFEEAMYVSVCAARSPKNRLAVASANGSRITLASDGGACAEVCLDTATCTCKRFTEGKFAEFGLACEHIVQAADAVSPHERLMRAIREK